MPGGKVHGAATGRSREGRGRRVQVPAQVAEGLSGGRRVSWGEKLRQEAPEAGRSSWGGGSSPRAPGPFAPRGTPTQPHRSGTPLGPQP